MELSNNTKATTCCSYNSILLSINVFLLSTLIFHNIPVESIELPNVVDNHNINNNNQPAAHHYIRQQPATLLHILSKSNQQVPNISSSVNYMQQPQQQQQQQQPILFNYQINPYSKAANEVLLELRQQMLTKSIRFDEHFRNLLSNSKLSLHNMFADTYGMIYEHNTEIFTEMFEGLEQYYANGHINLTNSMDNFFKRLYQKIFQVYNSNKVFSPSYLDCATEQLANLKPFRDVPGKLIGGIRHAFLMARTFVQALNNGIDVIKSIISLGQTAQCTNLINDKLLKNTMINNNNLQAPVIRLPCLNFCEQVIARCIGRGHLEELNDKWKGYVGALNELAVKLSTSYNIETIIAPMDVQISEAIMNFQENAQNITNQVSQVCGFGTSGSESHLNQLRPPSNRLGKRSARVATTSNSHSRHAVVNHQPLASLTLGGLRAATKEGFSHGSLLPSDLTPIGQKSPLLIEEIRNYMLSTRSFWLSFSNSVCTSNYTLGSNSSSNSKKQSCFQENFAVSDINPDVRYKVGINQQVEHLETMRKKIESAVAGVEFEWSSSSDQRHTMKNPTLNPNPRMTTSTTTTTTTTTPEPNPDDDEEEDPIGEDGSGDSPTDETEYPATGLDTEFETASESPDPDENTEDSDINDDEHTTSSINQSTNAISDNQDNTIDQSLNSEDTQTNLITPPNQAGAQKSSQTSSKLVISNGGHLMFALLLSVALLIVTKFHLILTSGTILR